MVIRCQWSFFVYLSSANSVRKNMKTQNTLRLVILAVMAAGAAASPTISPAAKAMYNPDLFQGDIKSIAGHEPGIQRAAKLDPQYLWPWGQVPYVFGSSVTFDQMNVIWHAMHDFHTKTCIRFVPRTNEYDYIEIVSDDVGCWSSVGRIGGMQRVSLNAYYCIYMGTAIHELMHAVGFFHEHTRNDRDDYVTIHYENILPNLAYNFNKDAPGEWQYVGEDYNYNSIMHYGKYAFSANNQPTMVPANPNVQILDPYQKIAMETSDANQISNLYSC